jgi:DNA-binding transcriptional MocR family regulator
VSPVTVSRALAALAAEGLVLVRPGAGAFIAAPRPAAEPADHSWQSVVLGEMTIDAAAMSPLFDPPHDEHTISLATGYLHPSLMPTRILSAAWTRAARLADVWERPPVSGLSSLRTWFARGAGPGIEPRDVTITPGGQAAISATFRALISAGETLLVESPTYPGAIAIARAAGIRPFPVPVDRDGVIPELLADAFARTGARAVYLQTALQNPTGAVLSPERRRAVLEVVSAAGAFVVEDDFARWLGHEVTPPPPLVNEDRDGRVVLITSLTKPTSPGLRVGAVIARGPVADRLRALRVVDDMFVARPVQEATLELVSRAGWPRHVSELSNVLARRRDVLIRCVAAHLPTARVTGRPTGGMHLWVRLPDGLDDVEVARAARDHGVVVMPGRGFFPAEPAGPHLRLTFAAAASEAELELGARRLARAVDEPD